MTTICIGPICIPLEAFLPLLYLIIKWFFTGGNLTSSSPENLPAPPPTVKRRKWINPTVIKIDDVGHFQRLKVEAKKLDIPLIIDFTASWCRPCKMIAPVFESFAKQYDAIFVKIDVDEVEALSHEFQIRAMPTFVVLKVEGGDESKILSRFSGCNKINLESTIKAFAALVVVDDENSNSDKDDALNKKTS